MSRIVVFGAAGEGRLGSRVVAETAARGHEVPAVVATSRDSLNSPTGCGR
ncbi:hypothetical protein [Streptomyces lomondensis]|nr:hypothetical protein [Streptomyces lomondensis]MCF0082749.1 hypothetical protein [Streptomyces lomondensis]